MDKNKRITFVLGKSVIRKVQGMEIEKKVESMLNQMNLDEKIAQTRTIPTNDFILDDEEKRLMFSKGELQSERIKKALQFGLGAFQLPGKNLSIEESVQYRNILQKYLKEHTRLGIPALVHEECLNGQLAKNSTMFPKPIAMASSFNVELVEQVYDVIGKETRARGGHQAFTPVLDLGRDPRWGRIEETYGEDTCLVSEIGLAAVKGLQGGKDGVEKGHIVASPKHFAGYGQCEGGRNFAPTNLTERYLRDHVFPPFEKAILEGGALGIMPSHAEIDGVPCHGNPWLLRTVLRDEWGFEGIVVSDYGDVERLEILHHIVDNKQEAAVRGLCSGVDIDAPSGGAYSELKEIIKNNPKLEKTLDEAVRRILKLKIKLGLLDEIYVDEKHAKDIVNRDEHKGIALKIAEESVVLLENRNQTLPLYEANLKKVAVIGPTADPVEFGYYSERPNVGVSILDGIRNKAKGKFEVEYEQGCGLTREKYAMETETDVILKNPTLFTLEEEAEKIEKAVQTAKKSDVVILCLGGSPDTSREAVTLMKHYGDNATLDLVGQQNELFRRIKETGVPVVVVLINGKPFSCGMVYENADAVLEAWYLGQETGTAVANILFGDVNPSGKLPVTIVRNAGHLPGYYSQKRTGFLKEYLFEKEGPYYWFGYGLSYTKFLYQNLDVEVVRNSDVMAYASIEVANIGEVTGKEIVQLYITDLVGSVTRPVKELKSFQKIELLPGENKKINFSITKDMLSFTGMNYDRIYEPGEFLIMIGTDCQNFISAKVII